MCKDDWGFGHGFAFRGFPFGPGRQGAWSGSSRGGRRRTQMFESGEMKFVCSTRPTNGSSGSAMFVQ